MALFGVNVTSLGSATSKETFYELLDKVHGGNSSFSTTTTAAAAAPTEAVHAMKVDTQQDTATVPAVGIANGKKGRVAASSLYPSSRIAQVFATELKQLRDDPEFSGTTSQISYLKDIVAADDQHQTGIRTT